MKFELQEIHGKMIFLKNYILSLFNRLDMNLPELGSVTLGITDIRKELIRNNEEEEEEDIPMEIIHTFDFNCSCNKCTSDGDDRVLSENRSFEKLK